MPSVPRGSTFSRRLLSLFSRSNCVPVPVHYHQLSGSLLGSLTRCGLPTELARARRHVISAVLRGAHKKKDSNFTREVARSAPPELDRPRFSCRSLSGRAGWKLTYEAPLPSPLLLPVYFANVSPRTPRPILPDMSLESAAMSFAPGSAFFRGIRILLRCQGGQPSPCHAPTLLCPRWSGLRRESS